MRSVSTSRSQLAATVSVSDREHEPRTREEMQMNRRVWTGVVAGVLAAAVLLTVGIGAYQAGRDDEVVTRTVDGGEVVRVVDHGRDFFPGFFLFPLLIILLVVLLVRGGRRHWYRPYGPGGVGGPGGPGWGPGYWGGGPGRGAWGSAGCDPDAGMREWHRRMHEEEQTGEGRTDAPADASPSDAGPVDAGPVDARPAP
jgi:hypothetical protein